MRKLFPFLVAALFSFPSLSLATPCAGCAGSCSGNNDPTCGCVHIEGCVCCGGIKDLSAGSASTSSSQVCVVDRNNKLRCGIKMNAKVQSETLKAAPKERSTSQNR